MSLSNHDFDSGMFELSAFLYAMKFPVLCANMWARKTSYIYSRVNKSAIIEVGGQRVGIVGYIHRHALKKSKNAVSVLFLPEIPALKEEVRRLEDEEGVDKIIALGHAGYYTDLKIAREVKGVDIVMGGDSDIMLFDPGDDESSKIGNIHGNYPRIHEQENDDPSLANRTLVVHIPQHGKYVGVLRATFDDRGKIIHESGEPVLLDSSIPQDRETLEFMKYAKGALEKIHEHSRLPDNAEILAKVTGWLDGDPRSCRMRECTLGNLVADAILHEFTFHYRNGSEHRYIHEQWGPIDAVVMNSGNIMHSIEPGDITIQDILRSVSLGGFIQRVYMSGKEMLDMMEHSVRNYDPWGVTPPGAFLQMAGLRVEYDLDQAPGRRVRSLQIRCRDCPDENEETYNPVKSYKTYVVGMPTFLMQGGDGYQEFEERDKYDYGQFDAQLIVEYMRRKFFIEPLLDDRIQFSEPNTTKSETGIVVTEASISPLTASEVVYDFQEHKTGILQNLTDNAKITPVLERRDKNAMAAGGMDSKSNFAVTSTKVGDQKKDPDDFTLNISASDTATQSVHTFASKYQDKSSLYNAKYFEEVGNEIKEDLKDLDALNKTWKGTRKSWRRDLSREESEPNASEVEANIISTRSLVEEPVTRNKTHYEEVGNNLEMVKNLFSPASISSTSKKTLKQVSDVEANTNVSYNDPDHKQINNLSAPFDRRSINQTGLETTNVSTPPEESGFINHFETYINGIFKILLPSSKNRPKVLDNSVSSSSDEKETGERNTYNDLQKLLNQIIRNFTTGSQETLLMELAKLFGPDEHSSKADGVEGNGNLLEKLPEFLQNVWKNGSIF